MARAPRLTALTVKAAHIDTGHAYCRDEHLGFDHQLIIAGDLDQFTVTEEQHITILKDVALTAAERYAKLMGPLQRKQGAKGK